MKKGKILIVLFLIVGVFFSNIDNVTVKAKEKAANSSFEKCVEFIYDKENEWFTRCIVKGDMKGVPTGFFGEFPPEVIELGGKADELGRSLANWHGAEDSIFTIVIGKNYTGSLEKLFHVFIKSTEKITIDKDNPKYASVDGVVFSKDMKQILYYPRKKNVGGSYTIPETVEKIGKMAFEETAIKEVKMGNKINTISQRAFDSSRILEVKIPDKVKTLGAEAFSNSKITNIDLNNVKKIKSSCFNYCNGLKTIDLKNVESIGKNAFYSCKNLKTVTGKKLKKVSRFAFWGETDLEKVYLTNGIKIGAETFDCMPTFDYGISFKKIKPYMFTGYMWNEVANAKGYQLKIKIFDSKNKKKSKTLIVNTKKSYMRAYGKTQKKMNKIVKKWKIKNADANFSFRAYTKKNKKKIYTKWSNVAKYGFESPMYK